MKRLLLLFALLMLLAAPSAAHEYDFSLGDGYHGVSHPVSDDVVPLNFYAGWRVQAQYEQGFNFYNWWFGTDFSEQQRKEVHTLGVIRNHHHTTWSVCMYISRCSKTYNEQGNRLIWSPPKNTENLMGFRISWTTSKWRPHDKPDQANRGNHWTSDTTSVAYVNSQSGIAWTLPSIVIQPGETLRIRIRARYRGEKNGDWSHVLHVPHPGLGCGSKNIRANTSGNLICHKKY